MDDIKVTPENIRQWAEETRQAAARFDNEWDVKAVEWDGYLTADCVVVECGSFKGRWALQIAQRYDPFLYCFEPQQWALLTAVEVMRLEGCDIDAHQYGLWHKTELIEFQGEGTDGCTGGQMVEVKQALRQSGIWYIDLMMINIEGGEYTLIPHMFAQGIFPQRFMVQCHEGPYDNLRKLIEQHYTNLWDYGRVLSAWERKP